MDENSNTDIEVKRDSMFSKSEFLEEKDNGIQNLDSLYSEAFQTLHLNYEGFKQMPPAVFEEKYKNLRIIYMKKNLLKNLPDEIRLLSNLVEIYLHANDLIKLPEDIGELKKLEHLDISGNKLTSLPSSIGCLDNLKSLQISNNKLRYLPKEIGKLKNLDNLGCANNNLRSLPSELVYCEKLSRLLVDRNSLYWIPRQLCSMKSLEELSIAGNNLLCLPMDLGVIKSLRSVYMDNNPYLHAVPLSVETQEIGFSSCGRVNFNEEDEIELQENLQSIDIKHSDNETKRIYLPREMSSTGDDCSPAKLTTLSLLELSMRTVHTHFLQALRPEDLPRGIYNLITNPVALCVSCGTPIFTKAYPVIFDAQIHVYSLYRLGLCCTQQCVRRASRHIQLPLVYPDLTTLGMAIAIVE